MTGTKRHSKFMVSGSKETLPRLTKISGRTILSECYVNGQANSSTSLLEDTPMIFAMLGIEDLIPLMVFGGIVAAIWACLSMISNRNSQALDRLVALEPAGLAGGYRGSAEGRAKEDKFQGLTDAAKSISKPLMPQTEVEQNALKTKLANAGFRSDAAPMVYSGIRLVCLAVLLLDRRWPSSCPAGRLGWKMLQGIVIMTGVGFYLPSVILWYLR